MNIILNMLIIGIILLSSIPVMAECPITFKPTTLIAQISVPEDNSVKFGTEISIRNAYAAKITGIRAKRDAGEIIDLPDTINGLEISPNSIGKSIPSSEPMKNVWKFNIASDITPGIYKLILIVDYECSIIHTYMKYEPGTTNVPVILIVHPIGASATPKHNTKLEINDALERLDVHDPKTLIIDIPKQGDAPNVGSFDIGINPKSDDVAVTNILIEWDNMLGEDNNHVGVKDGNNCPDKWKTQNCQLNFEVSDTAESTIYRIFMSVEYKYKDDQPRTVTIDPILFLHHSTEEEKKCVSCHEYRDTKGYSLGLVSFIILGISLLAISTLVLRRKR